MKPRSQPMASSIFLQPPPAKNLLSMAPSADTRPSATGEERNHEAGEASKRRTFIWELHNSLHCSIIGTCLSSAELRRLLIRLKVSGADIADEHDLHMLGVLLAGRPKTGAKFLQKALDRRHGVAINQFARAKSASELAKLWDGARRRGDIPGAFWAVVTHPACTAQLIKRAFGDVHMLSHLVGATNRADIRRLHELERQNADLTEKIERQQKQLRDGFVDRDKRIRRLDDLLGQKAAEEQRLLAQANDASRFLEVIHELERRLDEEIARRQYFEQRLALVSVAHEQFEAVQTDAERERDALRQELTRVETQIDAVLQPDGDLAPDALDLTGLTVLYVGGRAKQIPQLRALVERTKGCFLHHDGGVEHSPTLLPGLVGRADVSLFPVDCVSHDAVASVKRMCTQTARPYIPLRTSSLTCLLSALVSLRQQSWASKPSTLQ
jgi:hypothetical protein